ncbi:2458_t:CDS:2 [Racocetra persica]|uniref:2458_t:CDS:1 n=1 Tax=Racocetra persica TaxID=160502 RepID=A0ACA9NWY9_9GLOM|nr:2458_t:CDS:2 [Racocetra persica]
MIVIPYFPKIISIFIICSITLVESLNCPLTPNPHESLQTFIIQLSSTASRDVINNHYAMLISCFNKIISNDFTIQSSNPSIIKDVSFGSFICYIGKFGPSDAARLARLPEVANVERNIKFNINSMRTPTTETSTIPNNLDRIDQPSLPLDGIYNFPSSAGSNVNVYVVDTGINVNHTEFGGRAIFGPVFCEGCPPYDDNGMSIGFFDTSFVLNNATAEVGLKGVHVVLAAGNSATNACLFTPQSAPNAITVAATETNTDSITDFSNFGICVNIFAPGNNLKLALTADLWNWSHGILQEVICTNITAAGNRSSTDLIAFTGTSQASPHVAGAVALIIASSGNKSPDEMKKFLDDISTKDVVTGYIIDTPNRFIRVPHS